VKADGSHPAGERIRHARQEQHVRRACEKEAAGRASAIHLDLQRKEELRSALDLVDDRSVRKPRDEPRGIGLRGASGGVVVEVEIVEAEALSDLDRKRRLAALARPVDDDDRGVGERIDERLFGEPRQVRVVGHAADCKRAMRLSETLRRGSLKPCRSAARRPPRSHDRRRQGLRRVRRPGNDAAVHSSRAGHARRTIGSR